MNYGLAKNELDCLSRLAADDILRSRPSSELQDRVLDEYAGLLTEAASRLRFAYTAFDGDHQMLCTHMRRRVVAEGLVPANPDSVLGYKDTVLARQTKEGVLLDDLSVLRGCDELWVFTELPPVLDRLSDLAEGVLVELLYFLRRYPDRDVRFVSIGATTFGSLRSDLQDFPHSYDAVVETLSSDQRGEVLRLANSGVAIDRRLRSLTYYLVDPLDYKYARFVRAEGYEKDQCPLVPYLAVRPEDFTDCSTAFALALIHWAKLMRLASHCRKLPRLDAQRDPSQIVGLLERVWLRYPGSNRIADDNWEHFRVPKASQKERWAITARERASYGNG